MVMLRLVNIHQMKKIKKLHVGRSKRFKVLSAVLAIASITAFVWGATRFQPDREQSGAQSNACDNIPCEALVRITVQGITPSEARFFSNPYTFGTCNDPSKPRIIYPVSPLLNSYSFTFPYNFADSSTIWCRGYQFGPPDGVYLYANTYSELTGYTVNFVKSTTTIVSDQNGNILFGNAGVDCSFGNKCKFNFYKGTAYVFANFALKPPSAPSLSIVSSTQNSINLSWTASTPPSQSTVRYNVYRNNSLIASNLNTTTFNHGGLSCGQSYTYHVTAVATGTYGGTSTAQSNSRLGSTSACPPQTPPPSGGGSSTGGGTSGGGGTSSGGGTSAPSGSGGGSSTGGGTSPSSGGGSVPSSVGSRRTTPPSGSGGSTAAAASDSSAPSTPNGFTATSALGDVGVNLSWQASTDNIGVAGYKLERSDDNGTTWIVIGDAIQGTASVDADTKFSAHYEYRLSAYDAAGNYSGYATASVDTAGFQPNAGPNQEVTLTSGDNIVSVTIPSGALSEDSVCSIEIDANLGESPDVTGYVLAAGPYQIVCKNKDGINASSFNEAVKVTIDTTSFKKYDALAYYNRQFGTGQWDNISNVTSDSSTKTDTFELTDSTTFAIMGKPHKTPLWIKLLWILIIVSLLAVGAYFFIRWRKKHVAEQMYDDYYRKSQGL